MPKLAAGRRPAHLSSARRAWTRPAARPRAVTAHRHGRWSAGPSRLGRSSPGDDSGVAGPDPDEAAIRDDWADLVRRFAGAPW